MDRNIDPAAAAHPRKVPLRDACVALLAVVALVFGNVGVVRALDIALDALHR
jgi:hypothetical protein